MVFLYQNTFMAKTSTFRRNRYNPLGNAFSTSNFEFNSIFNLQHQFLIQSTPISRDCVTGAINIAQVFGYRVAIRKPANDADFDFYIVRWQNKVTQRKTLQEALLLLSHLIAANTPKKHSRKRARIAKYSFK